MRRLLLAILLMQSAAPAAIRDIVTRLQQFKDDSRDVPPAVATDLTALKHAFRDLVIKTVSLPESVSTPPTELAARVIEQVEDEDVPVGINGSYGTIQRLEIARPAKFREWLIATVSLNIPYGDDTSLYVFQLRGGAWHYALSLESNGYKVIYGAQGWLQYRVGLSESGKPFLVTTEVTPSNVSVWQGLTLRVLRIGPTPDRPQQLVSRTLSYCLDQPYQVEVHPGGFGLLYLGDAAEDQMGGSRGLHYVQYRVDSLAASIVREAAVDPENRVKRWAKLSWAVASSSIEPSARDIARAWHQRLREAEWECRGPSTKEVNGRLLAAVSCRHLSDKPEVYVMLRAGARGIQVSSFTTEKPQSFDQQGETIWSESGPDITKPVVEKMVQPFSPIAESVKVAIVVKADGSVGSISVLTWPDQPGLVVPAIRAVRQWKFEPAMKDGTPVNVSTTVDVTFIPR